MQGMYPVNSVESPLSVSSFKNCSMKMPIDRQPSAHIIDESLSPASLDPVIVAERDMKIGKYTNASPIHSPGCLEADKVNSDFFRCCFVV